MKILIIKFDCLVSAKAREEIQKDIVKQAKEGVVVLDQSVDYEVKDIEIEGMLEPCYMIGKDGFRIMDGEQIK